MEPPDRKAKKKTKEGRRTTVRRRKAGPKKRRRATDPGEELAAHGEKLEKTRAEQALLEAHASGPRKTFDLYLYPSEDSVEGLIVDPLTDDFDRFKGLDGPAITAFLWKHVPRRETPVSEPQLAAPSREEPAPAPEASSSRGAVPGFQRFTVVPAGGGHLPTVRQGQPFEVRLDVDTLGVTGETARRLGYKASVSAKRLEDGWRHAAGEISGDLDARRATTATVPCEPLPLGMYRLEATATLSSMPVGAKPPLRLSEQTLIRVR